MISYSVYDGQQPRSVKDMKLEIEVEKGFMDIYLSCSDQLVKLFDSRPVCFARIFEKKKVINVHIKLFRCFFIAV